MLGESGNLISGHFKLDDPGNGKEEEQELFVTSTTSAGAGQGGPKTTSKVTALGGEATGAAAAKDKSSGAEKCGGNIGVGGGMVRILALLFA